MNDLRSHVDVWYELYILQATYISFYIDYRKIP